jgi:hypothetical protein
METHHIPYLKKFKTLATEGKVMPYFFGICKDQSFNIIKKGI